MTTTNGESAPASKRITQKILAWKYSDYCFFFLAIAIFHVLIEGGTGDDVYFGGVLDGSNGLLGLPSWLAHRWNDWSSRLLIETALAIVASLPLFVWKILDSLIWLLSYHALVRLLGFESRTLGKWLLVALLLQYPFLDMSTAGWVATTVNYIWPLSLGLYSLSIAKNLCTGIKVCIPSIVAAFLACAYAANLEQMCAILFVSFLIMLPKAIRDGRRKVIFPIALFLALATCELLFELLCPGNSVRFASEVATWFPEYETRNIIEKLDLGFVHLMNAILSQLNLAVLLLLAILAGSSLKRRRGWAIGIISVLPIFIYLGRTVLVQIFPILNKLFGELIEFGAADGLSAGNLVRTLIAIIMVVAIAASCFLSMKERRDGAVALIALGAGFASALIIGFSPTVYASGSRTLIFFYYAVFFTCAFVASRNPRHEKSGSLPLALFALSLLAVANTAYSIMA